MLTGTQSGRDDAMDDPSMEPPTSPRLGLGGAIRCRTVPLTLSGAKREI